MASGGTAVQVQNLIGKEVNGFEIMKLIGNLPIICIFLGQGKFSFVYKAQRKTDGLCVALKLIKVINF